MTKVSLAIAALLLCLLPMNCAEPESTDPNSASSSKVSSGDLLRASRIVGVWQSKFSVPGIYVEYLVLRADGSFLTRHVTTASKEKKAFHQENTGKYTLSADGKTAYFTQMKRPPVPDCSAFGDPNGPDGKGASSGIALVGKVLRLDFSELQQRKIGTTDNAIRAFIAIDSLPPLPKGSEPFCHPVTTI